MFLLLTVAALTGCDVDIDLNLTSSSIQLASDSGNLIIGGCANDGFLGCGDGNGRGGHMEVVLDGVVRTVPAYVPKPLELFPTRGFELVVPSPEDPFVEVTINGASVRVEEMPYFEIQWPDAVRRSKGAPTFVFQAFRDARLDVALTSRCGEVEQFQTFAALGGEDGRIQIPLTDPVIQGDCSHEARLTQTVREDNEIGAILEVARTEHATFTSTD